MATLNVKNFPDHIYRRLQERARQNRRSVSQEVVHLLEQAVAEHPRLSLLELEGLVRVWRYEEDDALSSG
jgi:plasmid stability protein